MIKYYKEQLGVSILRRLQTEKYYNGSVYKNCHSNIDDYDSIYFYLDYYRLMHQGDQFFFKPLFEQLKLSGFPVIAQPSKGLKFLFNSEKHIKSISKNTLFISSVLLLPHMKKCFGSTFDYFLFDTAALSIDRPISNYIVDIFSDYFSLSNILNSVVAKDFFSFSLNDSLPILKSNNKYIIFNNYLDSGRYRLFPKDRKLLLESLKINKEEETVVHIGSEKDMQNDNRDYTGVVDIDLRGKTNIKDLFNIFSMSSIVELYCHDTFVLHISNIFNNPASVVFRRFFKWGENEQKRNAYLSLFKKDTSMLSILN